MARDNFVNYKNMQDILNGIEQKISGLGSELTGIYTWTANSQYKIGDVVIANGSLFICQTVHTSSASFSADIANWILFYADISPWLPNTYYVVNACVINDKKLYQCKIAHTSDSTAFTTDIANWELIAGGGTTIDLWQTTTSYSVGDLVIESNILYRCKTAHTSGSTFDSAEKANWDVIGDDSGTTINDWVSGTSYSVGDLVIYNNSLYKCTTANSDVTFTPTKWQEIGGTPVNVYASKAVLWEGQAYTDNDVLNLAKAYADYDYIICYTFNGTYGAVDCGVYNSSVFQPSKESVCRVGAGRDNNASQMLGWLTFSGTTATLTDVVGLTSNWFLGRIEGIKFTTGGNGSIAKIPDWASGASYTDGDFVIYNNRLYKCTTTNSDIAFTESNWQEIGGASLSVKKTTLWSGMLYTTNTTVALSDVYDKYDYLLIYMGFDSNNTSSAEHWSEGVYWHDVSSGEYLDIHTGDTPSSSATSWATYKAGVRYASLKFSGNTMTLIGQSNLSAPTASKGGYYVSKVIGIEFLQSAGSVSDFTGATSSTDGTHGLVPKPLAGDEEKVLRGDGTWGEAGTSIDDWATSTAYKVDTYVKYNNVIYVCTTAHTSTTFTADRANWQDIKVEEMKGATSSANGTGGSVPAPTSADTTKFLCGDGTWKTAGGSAGVSVIKDLLWTGNLKSDVSASNPETLNGDYRDYDYLEFVAGWEDTAGAGSNGLTVLNSAFIEIYNGMTNPCLTIAYNSAANTTYYEHLDCDLDFSSITSFNGGVKRYRDTNATSGLHLFLWKIYGIKLVNAYDYSTTEKRIGSWVDGKPLYQVTWVGTTPNVATESPLFKVDNVDKIVFMDGTYLDTADNILPMSYSSQNTNDYCYIFWDKSNSYVTMKAATAGYRNTYCQITVRYTKT